MIDNRYYSTVEAGQVLGCDAEQVLAWIHAGDLVAVNVAKTPNAKRPTWRIAEADLGRFLLSRRHPASQQQAAPRVAKRAQPNQYV